MLVHVCYAAVVACRLGNDFTWDALLSAVGSFCFTYQVMREPWSLDLRAAVGRLNSSRSMEAKLQYSNKMVRSPVHTRDLFGEYGECHEQCGACDSCLEAKEVMALDVACSGTQPSRYFGKGFLLKASLFG